MAIEFEQKRSIHWSRLFTFVIIIAAIVIATYYLFFAPSPKIDLIIPAPLEQAEEISTIEFIDPSQIIRNPAFGVFRGTDPGPGAIGRANPFLPL